MIEIMDCDKDAPQAEVPLFQHLVATYASETNKTGSAHPPTERPMSWGLSSSGCRMDQVSGQAVRYQGVTCECPSLARRWRDADRPADHAEHHPVFPEQEPHEQETCRPYQGSEDHDHIHGLWLNWHRAEASGYPAAQEPTGSPGNAPFGIAADQPEEHTGNRQDRHSTDHHTDDLDAPSLSQPPNHADQGSEEEPSEKHAEDSASKRGAARGTVHGILLAGDDTYGEYRSRPPARLGNRKASSRRWRFRRSPDSLAFIFVAKMDAANVAGRAQREIGTDDQSVV